MELQIGTWRIAVEQIRPSTTDLANTYNHIAANWQDSITRLGYPIAYGRLFDQLIDEGALSTLKNESHVLDAGIGTGAVSEALLKSTGLPLHIHGIDISDEMLGTADRRLSRLTPIRTMGVADLLETPFEANRFDMVTAAHTLEHLENPREGLEALVRMLKPGAPLVLVISRKTIFSNWLRLKWAISRTSPADLEHCFTSAGLEQVRLIPLKGRPWIRQMSLACVGFKRLP